MMNKVMKYGKILIYVIFFWGYLIGSAVHAQSNEMLLEKRVKQLEQENAELKSKVEGLSDFTAYKENYILFYSAATRDKDKSFPSEDAEVKFQVSVRQRVLTGGWGTAYLGYTQKSFWRMYDGED